MLGSAGGRIEDQHRLRLHCSHLGLQHGFDVRKAFKVEGPQVQEWHLHVSSHPLSESPLLPSGIILHSL